MKFASRTVRGDNGADRDADGFGLGPVLRAPPPRPSRHPAPAPRETAGLAGGGAPEGGRGQRDLQEEERDWEQGEVKQRELRLTSHVAVPAAV